MSLWNKIDLDVEPKPFHLSAGDDCYFAREYISEGGWQASKANQLILNFKKSPDKRGTGEWYWKEKAARDFAHELAEFLPKDLCIAVIPTSKPDDHPDYDSRFDMMLSTLNELRPDLETQKPIIRTEPCQSLHKGGKRSVAQALRTLRWAGFEEIPDHVVLIDDVITCGTNFKACQSLLSHHCPGIAVSGVFWAKTVRLADDAPD